VNRPEGLHAALVVMQLKVRPRGFTLTVLDEVDSTTTKRPGNSRRKNPPRLQYSPGGKRGAAAGFGRTWHSGFPGNLYASFCIPSGGAPESMQTFTLWMGVNVCE